MTVNRRVFIASSLAAAGGAVVLPGASGAAGRGVGARAADPFSLGVASGDPAPDSVVLWTRLATKPLEVGGGMGEANVPVEWQIATDQAFGKIVASGTETATPGLGHSVHALPKGLQPGAEYFYRFRVGTHISPVGRTRTAPAPGTDPGSLTFAMASCQHFERGYYAAHHFIARDEPDLVVFLGDYMYEKPTDPKNNPVRHYVQHDEVNTLTEYRLRYAQTHHDPHLRAAHAAAPWIAVFDDHELENNWWGGSGKDGEVSNARKAASFQAFWENMPLRTSRRPDGPSIDLYRRVRWGTLARFHMLDTRQYRDRQVQSEDRDCSWTTRPDRSLTGDAQERWLLDGLAEGGSRWDLLGQQVFFAGRDRGGTPKTCDDRSKDSWDGYPHSRRRITRGWVDRQVRNPVVLTGDVHKHWANNVKLDYFDPDARPVGAELVTTSATSGDSGPKEPDLSHTPHLHYLGNPRGYVRVRVGTDQLTAEFMKVSSIRKKDMGEVDLRVAAKYVVRDGVPGLRKA